MKQSRLKSRLAIFISGRGSNLLSLIRATQDEDYPASISLVISDQDQANGLSLARKHAIPTHIMENDETTLKFLADHEIDIICLAGFMTILHSSFLQRWQKPILNIHPSLLPLYKGLGVHERVLADGASISGCTVHHVTAELDSGTIIAQQEVAVGKNDTAHSLAARILEEEHRLYPRALKKFIENRTG